MQNATTYEVIGSSWLAEPIMLLNKIPNIRVTFKQTLGPNKHSWHVETIDPTGTGAWLSTHSAVYEFRPLPSVMFGLAASPKATQPLTMDLLGAALTAAALADAMADANTSQVESQELDRRRRWLTEIVSTFGLPITAGDAGVYKNVWPYVVYQGIMLGRPHIDDVYDMEPTIRLLAICPWCGIHISDHGKIASIEDLGRNLRGWEERRTALLERHRQQQHPTPEETETDVVKTERQALQRRPMADRSGELLKLLDSLVFEILCEYEVIDPHQYAEDQGPDEDGPDEFFDADKSNEQLELEALGADDDLFDDDSF